MVKTASAERVRCQGAVKPSACTEQQRTAGPAASPLRSHVSPQLWAALAPLRASVSPAPSRAWPCMGARLGCGAGWWGSRRGNGLFRGRAGAAEDYGRVGRLQDLAKVVPPASRHEGGPWRSPLPSCQPLGAPSTPRMGPDGDICIFAPLPEPPDLRWHGRVRGTYAGAGGAARRGPIPLALAFFLAFHE